MTIKAPRHASTSLAIALLALLATTIFAQQITQPKPEDQKTVELVSSMIQRLHLKKARIDDALSEKLIHQFVKEIDGGKQYFMQADIDSFEAERVNLDDQLKAGKTTFGFDVFNLYKKRVAERVDLVHRLIDMDHDFTLDESIAIDPDHIEWAKTDEEIQDRWRKRIKYDILDLKLDGTEMAEIRTRLHRRYRNIKNNIEQLDNSEVLELYLSSMAHCIDPHSSYMSPMRVEDFQILMSTSLDGIGAELKSEDGYTIVNRVMPGGPADIDARLKVEDIITAVGQAEGELVDVVGQHLKKVVRLIRGQRGTKVRLQVKTKEDGKDITKVYELTRDKVVLQEQKVKHQIIDTQPRVSRAGRIGVISVPSFYRDFEAAQKEIPDFPSATRDVRAALIEFEKQGGVDAVVMDLRGNGGGALVEAIDMTGLFIPEGPVVQVKDRRGNPHVHRDEDGGEVLYKGPLVVLCNKLSASASEIFAGAIKDYRRGIVVGDSTTHGKGTVQNVMTVAPSAMFSQLVGNEIDRGSLKLTIQQFYRVNGDSTQNRGVPSDIIIPSEIDAWEIGEAFLDNALAFEHIDSAKYAAFDLTSADMVDSLARSSKLRIKQDEEFNKVLQHVDRYLDRKQRKAVTLNEAKLKVERQEDEGAKKPEDLDEDLNSEKDKDKKRKKPEEAFPDDFYNKEILNISLDYVAALAKLTAGRE